MDACTHALQPASKQVGRQAGKARQGKARRDEARRGEARQGKVRQGRQAVTSAAAKATGQRHTEDKKFPVRFREFLAELAETHALAFRYDTGVCEKRCF